MMKAMLEKENELNAVGKCQKKIGMNPISDIKEVSNDAKSDNIFTF